MSKSRIKTGFIAFMGVFIIVVCLITVNKYSHFLKAKRNWNEKKQDLETVKNEIAEIKVSLKKYEKEKAEFEEYLFSEQDVPSFLDGISKYAQKASINIVDMKTNKFQEVIIPYELQDSQSKLSVRKRMERKRKELREKEGSANFSLVYLPISVQVEGSFRSFVQFLSFLEEFKQLLLVSNVKIVSGKEYPTLKCNFSIKIFSLRDLNEK